MLIIPVLMMLFGLVLFGWAVSIEGLEAPQPTELSRFLGDSGLCLGFAGLCIFAYLVIKSIGSIE